MHSFSSSDKPREEMVMRKNVMGSVGEARAEREDRRKRTGIALISVGLNPLFATMTILWPSILVLIASWNNSI